MLLDVGIEFHRQHARFKGVAGVEAGFQLVAIGCAVPDCVRDSPIRCVGHDPQ